MASKLALGELGCVLVVIVLLENEAVQAEVLIAKGTQEKLLKDGAVLLCIHDAVDLV